MVKKLLKALFGPMPLNNFGNYDDYWEKRGGLHRFHRYEVVANRIEDGTSVVDIGCGEGAFLECLLEIRKRCRVFGFDVSSVAIRKLHERGIDGAVIGEMPISEALGGACDHVVMMEVLEHVHDAEGLFAEAARLNPTSMFITIPNAGYLIHRLRLLFGRFPITAVIFHVKEHIRFWTVRDFNEWVLHMGWRVYSCTGQEWSPGRIQRALIRICPSLFAGQVIYEVRRI